MNVVVELAKDILAMQQELEFLRAKVKNIEHIIQTAEEFAEDQTLSESVICMGALKDIRRKVREKQKL